MARRRARGGASANQGQPGPNQPDPNVADPDTAARGGGHDPDQPRRRSGKGPFLLAIAAILLAAGALLVPRLITRLVEDESAETKAAGESKEARGKKIPKFVEEHRFAFYSARADGPNSKWERAWGWGTGSLLGWGELPNTNVEWFAWSNDEALTFEVSKPLDTEGFQAISSLGDDWTVSNQSRMSVITRANWMRDYCTGHGDDLTCAYTRCLYESARELRALDVFADFKVGATYD